MGSVTVSRWTPILGDAMRNRPRTLVLAVMVVCISIARPGRDASGSPSDVIGNDNSVPIMTAPEAWRNRRAPVAVILRFLGNLRVRCGTGFLVDDDCLITAAHALTDGNGKLLPLKKYKIYFKYEDTTQPFEKDRVCFDAH